MKPRAMGEFARESDVVVVGDGGMVPVWPVTASGFLRCCWYYLRIASAAARDAVF
jgi:uncharacterized protein YodC (DUF2158 family)